MAKKKATAYKWDEFFRRLKNSIFRPKRQTKDIVFRLVFGNDMNYACHLHSAIRMWDAFTIRTVCSRYKGICK